MVILPPRVCVGEFIKCLMCGVIIYITVRFAERSRWGCICGSVLHVLMCGNTTYTLSQPPDPMATIPRYTFRLCYKTSAVYVRPTCETRYSRTAVVDTLNRHSLTAPDYSEKQNPHQSIINQSVQFSGSCFVGLSGVYDFERTLGICHTCVYYFI